MIADKFRLIAKYFPQVFASWTASLGTASDGIQYAWQSPSVPKLLEPNSPIPMSQTDLVLLDSMWFLGSIASLPLISYLSNKLGRKPTLQLVAVLFCIAWLMIAFCNNSIQLFVARFLAGFGSNACYSTAPLYIAEVGDKNIRGFLGCLVYVNFMIGVVLIYSVAPFISIQNAAFVSLSVPVIQLITFSFMPESPYCCFIKNNPKEAKKSLQFLRHSDDVQEELCEIKAAVKRQESEKGTVKDLFTVASNRKGVIIMFVLYCSQNFSASTILFTNLHLILNSAEGLFDVNISAIVFAVVMLIGAFVGTGIVEKLGRVRLMNYSCALTGFSLGLLCVYFWLQSYKIDLHHVSWLPAIAVVIYAISFMSGLGLIPVLISSELFPTTVKCNGITIAVGFYTVSAFITMYFHRYVTEAAGIHICFLVYTICCLGTIAFNIYYVPETTGKTLEEIQMMLKGRKVRNNNKRGQDKTVFVLNA